MIDIDLFAGPGGWDEGIKHLGIYPLGFEWGDAQCDTARAAGHRRIQGDIAKMDPRQTLLGSLVRLQISSPPCQGFSMAGKGKGRDDAVLLLRAIPFLKPSNIDAAIADLHARMTDDRSLLVLEPLRWAMAVNPMYLAWEQVPAVLPIWEKCAEVLRRAGYSVATGIVNAEQYGVPQTRRRAILVARGDGKEARLPVPTHSRYYSRSPEKLDEGVEKWVSMAEALGWGMTRRPSMTVTGGGTATGGAEPFGNGARQSMRREMSEGRWIAPSGVTGVGRPRPDTHPAPTITGQANAYWMDDLGQYRGPAVVQRSNYSAYKAGATTAEERGRTTRSLDEPSLTVTSKGFRWEPDADAVAAEVGPRVNNQSGTEFDLSWPARRPAPVIAGRDLVTMPGANANRFNGATKSRNDGVRVTVEEAGILQSFPADYPWQGNKGEQFQQVGDAVPPLLAYAIVKEILS